MFNHLLGAWYIGTGQIDLINDGNDLKPVMNCQVGICKRLRLDALRCVDNEKGTLARS